MTWRVGGLKNFKNVKLKELLIVRFFLKFRKPAILKYNKI